VCIPVRVTTLQSCLTRWLGNWVTYSNKLAESQLCLLFPLLNLLSHTIILATFIIEQADNIVW
jgi:hypothetical protein